MTMHTSGNSSIDTSLIRDTYFGPEVLFETCVAIKFVDDNDDDEHTLYASYYHRATRGVFLLPSDTNLRRVH